MAKPTDLTKFTNEERKILVDAIPLLRNKDNYYWEEGQFKELYAQWLRIPNNPYADDGFSGFKMAVAKAKKMQPYMIKTTDGYALTKEAQSIDQSILVK